MTMGVATANSILLVSFARAAPATKAPRRRSAALEAGATRIRPVLMTALAMIIGMIPMALGIGEGGEQNAPLGRAVIGGLLFATVSTLLFVPVVFAGIHERLRAAAPHAARIGSARRRTCRRAESMTERSPAAPPADAGRARRPAARRQVVRGTRSPSSSCWCCSRRRRPHGAQPHGQRRSRSRPAPPSARCTT